jgi:hypothetical protein
MRMKRWSEPLLVFVSSLVATTIMTWPLVTGLGRLGRIETADGRFSIWNVAWVAHALLTSPRHLFDANIFYPHRGTLVYSEANLGAGVLAVPAYLLTGNPYTAHNVVVLLAFTLAATGMYFLVRLLTGHRGAAAYGAVAYAFCPFMLARTPHIQLLMNAGLPFAMLGCHRLAQRPNLTRALTLGAILAAQALSCGYYGVFVALLAGFTLPLHAAFAGRWRQRAFWFAGALAALTSVALVYPFLSRYRDLQHTTGFGRSLLESVGYAADWRAYLASASHAHRWILGWLGHWNEVLFPGILTSLLGLVGLWALMRRWPARQEATGEGDLPTPGVREIGVIYGGVAILGGWMSFGPEAGLYAACFKIIPFYSLLRAPSRFGILVTFALVVLAGCALTRWLPSGRRGTALAAVLTLACALEVVSAPIPFREAEPVSQVYRALATLPRGPVAEIPFFYRLEDRPAHTLYMLSSTAHWQPLINGYSDYIPQDFTDTVLAIATFPSDESFHILEQRGARYVVVHYAFYAPYLVPAFRARIEARRAYLRRLVVDGDHELYEIISWPH